MRSVSDIHVRISLYQSAEKVFGWSSLRLWNFIVGTQLTPPNANAAPAAGKDLSAGLHKENFLGAVRTIDIKSCSNPQGNKYNMYLM